jgi:hypothetical protein
VIRLLQVVIAVLIAALVYWLALALGLPSIIAVVAALLVVIAALAGVGDRWRL